ncbi:hypothetical protein NT6N_20100 [Oceaniferula spumae]|uniref:Ice-binding protein C-terminal domain-containing protein n=1 Tax=Oceaniferula spumae TaxID=2979115 RepID=A0AAT9FLT0_9BACT
MKHTLLSILTIGACSLTSHAAVILAHEYHLGEAGSLSGADTIPQDSAGSAHFTAPSGAGTATVETAGVFAPGSTAYISTADTSKGWFGADFTSLPADNFAFGIFARAASNTTATRGVAFQLGTNTNNTLKITLNNNGWGASAHGVSWIGGTQGVSGSFVADEWVHLALIRQSGTTTLYIDGAAQTGTWGGTPVFGSGHMVVTPGGGTYFDGHLDEGRVVTFDPSDSTTAILNTLQGVPEPSSTALLGLGAMALILRRRK